MSPTPRPSPGPRPSRPARRLALAAGLSLALALPTLTACGSQEPSAASPSPAPAPTSSSPAASTRPPGDVDGAPYWSVPTDVPGWSVRTMDQDGKNQLGNAVGCLFTTSQDAYQTSGRTDREETDLQAEKTTHSYEGSKVTLSPDKEHIIELLNRRTHLVVLVLQELTCNRVVVLAIDLIRTDIPLIVKVKLHQGKAPKLG